MKLVRFELLKLFSRNFVSIGLAFIVIANLLLLFAYTDTGSAESNRKLMMDLEGMSLEEKQAAIEERYETVYHLCEIDGYLRHGMSDQTRNIVEDLLKQYGSLYENNSYKLYTEDLESEFFYLQDVRSEISVVSGFEDFLENTQTQYEQFQKISIFSNSGSYESLNMEKAAKDYRDLIGKKIVLDYYPQKGLITALSFEYTDIFILISMLLISGILINTEFDSGIFAYIRTNPKGRRDTAAAKWSAMVISAFFIVILLYGVNLVYCQFAYGLGSLSRSIQSVPYLMRSTMYLRIYQYLLLFLLLKWITASILGMAVMIIMLCVRHYIFGTGISFAFYYLNLFIYTKARPNTILNIFRFSNPAGLLKVNEWLGTYLNYRIFERPVSSKTVVFVSASVWALMLFLILLSAFVKVNPGKSELSLINIRTGSSGRPTTVMREELYKTYILGGVVFILLGFLAAEGYMAVTKDNLVTVEEIFYRDYMKPISGKYDEKAYETLEDIYMSEDYRDAENMNELMGKGLISSQEYQSYYYANYTTYKRMDAFSRVINRIEETVSSGKEYIIYETGYLKLFDIKEKRDISDTLICIFVMLICCCNIFAQERRAGMEKVLETTPGGCRKLVITKIKTVMSIALAVTAVNVLSDIAVTVKDYGLPAFFAPANCIKELSALPGWVSIFLLYLFFVITRFIGNLLCGILTAMLSRRTGNALTTLFAGFVLLMAPLILSLIGISELKALSVYPLFHFSFYISRESTSVYAMLFSGMACILTFYLMNVLAGDRND